MQCMKCGRETGEDRKNVFCPECLKVMDACPVAPGTKVRIPKRDAAPRRSPTHSAPKPEAVIEKLSRKIFRLRIIIVILVLLYLITTGVLGFFLYRSLSTPDLGSNYSTVSTTEP